MITLPSLGSYIDESWSLYKNYFKSYSRITSWYVITVLLALIGSILLPTYGGLPFVDNIGSTFTPSAIAGLVLTTINHNIIRPILILWIIVGLIKFMKRTYEETPDPSESMSDAWRVLGPAIGITILVALMLVAVFIIPWIPGMIFIVLGLKNGGMLGLTGIVLLTLGIITGLVLLFNYFIRYNFARYEVIVGNATVTSSLSRSYDMTHGSFWPIFWRWFIGFILVLIIGVTISLILYPFGVALVKLFSFDMTLFERMAVTIDLVFSVIVFMIIAPLLTAFEYTLYRHVAKK